MSQEYTQPLGVGISFKLLLEAGWGGAQDVMFHRRWCDRQGPLYPIDIID